MSPAPNSCIGGVSRTLGNTLATRLVCHLYNYSTQKKRNIRHNCTRRACRWDLALTKLSWCRKAPRNGMAIATKHRKTAHTYTVCESLYLMWSRNMMWPGYTQCNMLLYRSATSPLWYGILNTWRILLSKHGAIICSLAMFVDVQVCLIIFVGKSSNEAI